MSEERDALILNWSKAVRELAAAKELEAELRKQVVDTQFDSNKTEGTQTISLGNGWKLKAVKTLNYNLDKDEVDAALANIEESCENGQFIAERLVKFKPELSVSEYKKLDASAKKLIDAVLTTKPGTPQLKLEGPKQ